MKSKKYVLSGMSYDEVSLVDSGGDQDAHVVLFKRDVSKGLLNPEDVHTPSGVWNCAKCGKKHRGSCSVSKAARKTKQMRDHNGRWVSTSSAVPGTATAKGFFILPSESIEKAWRFWKKQPGNNPPKKRR